VLGVEAVKEEEKVEEEKCDKPLTPGSGGFAREFDDEDDDEDQEGKKKPPSPPLAPVLSSRAPPLVDNSLRPIPWSSSGEELKISFNSGSLLTIRACSTASSDRVESVEAVANDENPPTHLLSPPPKPLLASLQSAEAHGILSHSLPPAWPGGDIVEENINNQRFFFKNSKQRV